MMFNVVNRAFLGALPLIFLLSCDFAGGSDAPGDKGSGTGGSQDTTGAGGGPGSLPGTGGDSTGGTAAQGGSGGSPGTGGTATGGAPGSATGGSGGTATGGTSGTATGGTGGQGNVAYPAGPYGFAIGSTVADLAFTDGAGNPVKLSTLRSKPGVKVIVWSSGAEWCTICKIQAPKLEKLHKTLASEGLFVFESLHQSSNGSPATVETTSRWVEAFKVTYPVYVEKSPNHAGHNDNPLELVIDAATMKVRYRQQHTSSDLDSQVKSALDQAGK